MLNVNIESLQKIFMLKNGYSFRMNCMQMRNEMFIWNIRLHKIIISIIHWATWLNLIWNWFELQYANECDLIIQLERIHVTVIKFNQALERLNISFLVLNCLIYPLIVIRWRDTYNIRSLQHTFLHFKIILSGDFTFTENHIVIFAQIWEIFEHKHVILAFFLVLSVFRKNWTWSWFAWGGTWLRTALINVLFPREKRIEEFVFKLI